MTTRKTNSLHPRRLIAYAVAGFGISLAISWVIAFVPLSWYDWGKPVQSARATWLWNALPQFTASTRETSSCWCSTYREVVSVETAYHTPEISIRTCVQSEQSTGWPFPAMAIRAEYNAISKEYRYLNTYRIRRGLQHDVFLPLLPRWLPLIANTIFWSCIVAVLHMSFLRLWQRQSTAGYCRKCRYDARGLPTCPECGTPVHVP